MSSPTTARRRPSGKALIGIGAAVVVLVVLVLLLVTGGGDDEPSTPAASEASSSSPAPSGVSTSPAPTVSDPPPTPSPAGDTGNAEAGPSSLPAVGLDEEVEVGDVTARLDDVSRVDASGVGVGNVSGPAVQVTVSLTNGSGQALPLAGVEVTASTGDDDLPASPLDDGETRGLAGTLEAGASASGTYLFSVPEGADVVTVVVGYEAGAPLAVFSGSV